MITQQEILRPNRNLNTIAQSASGTFRVSQFTVAILVFECCGNYLCHLCTEDFIEMEKAHPEFGVKCPLCQTDKLVLNDVNPEQEVRRYADSAYEGSPK